MQHCTACNKAFATVHILDLRDGAIVEQKHLCTTCAENAGMVQQKVPAMKLPVAEVHELISSFKSTESDAGAHLENIECPGCGLTAKEFKVRGRMGCPRCYDTFKNSLIPLLERVHDATSHRGRVPGTTPDDGDVGPMTAAKTAREAQEELVALRHQLERAIDTENYEEAARLRDAIKAATSRNTAGGAAAAGEGETT